MRRSLTFIAIVSLLIAFPILTFAQEKPLVGVGARGLYDDFAVTIQAKAAARLQELGAKAVTFNAMLDPQLQLDQLDTMGILGVKAVILVPMDSKAIVPGINKLRQKGIIVITQDVAPIGGEVDLHIAVDNAMAGQKAGEALIALLTKRYGRPKGTVLEIMGDLRHDVTPLRSEGFHRVVDKYKEITVINKPADWDPNKAFDLTKNTLAAQKDKLVGIYQHSDIYSPGTFPAIKAAGREAPRNDPKHVFVVSIDGAKIAMDMIQQGKMDHTSVQPAGDYGVLAAEWAMKLIQGEAIPPDGTIIEKKGELWSPAVFKMTPIGPALFLNVPAVPGDAAPTDPRIWGNARG